MNYITEINEFYDWLETNQMPKSAIALWHALMHISNKARWQKNFAVAISTIESKTGFKRSELFEARNILQQKGLLRWKARGGNLSAEYELVSFSVHTADANTYSERTQVRTQTPTQTGTINKQNKTEESIYSPPGNFSLSTEIELPANVLESAQMNQFTKTKNKNTDFIYENWRIF